MYATSIFMYQLIWLMMQKILLRDVCLAVRFHFPLFIVLLFDSSYEECFCKKQMHLTIIVAPKY